MAQVEDTTTETVSPDDLRSNLSTTAMAFRGYNTTNLGLSPELMERDAYRPIIEEYLNRGSAICSKIQGRDVDLVARVRNREETSLDTYDEAISMIVAMEIAHVEILKRLYEIDIAQSQFAFGFSLGEIAALVAGGVLNLEDAVRIPLEMSEDCVGLSNDVTLGVLFSRRGELSFRAVSRLCQDINSKGGGVIGVSAFLAPNSLLLIGQGDTLDQLAARKKEISSERVYLRRNDNKWPPLHTPIMWQRAIPNRSQHLMHTMTTKMVQPSPPIFSLVTGAMSYDDYNVRDIVGRWVDHPQRLWDVVDYTLAEGTDTIVHIGPQPNIVPATFDRLASNVASQTKGSVRMRALSGMVSRPWLQALLPRRASLLRASQIRHVKLEEWLLENEPAKATA